MSAPAKRIEAAPGSLLAEVIGDAVWAATDGPVSFEFNGETYTVDACESYDEARARLSEERGSPILDREEMAEEARLSLERTKAEQEAAIAAAGVMTEAEMREADVPWLDSMEALTAYIDSLTDRPHDYGTCVYAMSMAAVAAHYYVAKKLGVTGFQASCADMDILRRTRGIDGGFRVVTYDDLLYPQHWDDERSGVFQAALEANPEHFRAKALALLAEEPPRGAEHVREHWRRIAEFIVAPETVEA